MKSFNQPQRQSAIGILILLGYDAQKFLRAFWPILLVTLVRNDFTNLYFILSVVGVILFLGIQAFLKYWFFRFYIDENRGEFVVEKGVIQKSKINIPLEKIQQVNLTQNILHKIVQVYNVEIDTAGSSNQEVSINALSLLLAKELKSKLLEGEKKLSEEGETSATTNINESKPLFGISFFTLLKIGLTSKYRESIALFLVFLIGLIDSLNKLEDNQLVDGQQVENYLSQWSALQFFVFSIPTIILLLLMVNLVRTLLNFFDYKVFQNDDTLLFRYGLLRTREVLLKPYKVQKFLLRQNWFQKKFSLWEIYIEQASSGKTTTKPKEKLQIPGANQQEWQQLLQIVFGAVPILNIKLYPNIRKWIISGFILSILCIPVIAFIHYVLALEIIWLLVGVYILLVWILTGIAFKNYRLHVNEAFIQKTSGVWDIDHELIPIYKIQGVETSQYFWQKKYDVGSVTIFTAGGNLSFNTTQYNKIVPLVNYWLYVTETSHKKWM